MIASPHKLDMRTESATFSAAARERTLFMGGLTVLLIAAAILRLHALGLPAYDCDELYALRIQGLSLKEIASVVGRSAFHDLHPPLSYLLFMPWIALFGTSEAAVRSLPMLLGLVSVALIGLVGRRIGGVGPGLAAAAFLAFNPLHIAYSQEARPYALAVTLTLAAHLFLLRSLREASARNLTVYALLIAAALYTHYFALIALLSHAFIASWLLLTGDEDSRRAARSTLLAFACAMATFIAWLPALVFQSTGQPDGPTLGVYDLGGSPLGRAGHFLDNMAGLGSPPFLLPAIVALLVLLFFALRWRERLPAAPVSSGSWHPPHPPRNLGAALLLAGLVVAAWLPLAVSRYLFAPARQVLLAKGYSPVAVERELHGLLQLTVSLPLTVGVIGLLVLGWPWLSSLLSRLSGTSPSRGRPLAINGLLAFLVLVPATVALGLALKGVPLLSDRNLLICVEPPLALALGVGAVRLAKVRWGLAVLVPVIVCLAFAGFQYQSLSGIFGVRGKPLGLWTGAWRDLVRELDRRDRQDRKKLPLVLVDAPRSDPAEFYLHPHSYTRIEESAHIEPDSLPAEFRFVHIKGNRSSEALLSYLSSVVSLKPELQVDEYVIYDAHPCGRPGLAAPGRGCGSG
jgi:4-amino-4-deoxy-L-arabinose transferase-like glycosyltransferase